VLPARDAAAADPARVLVRDPAGRRAPQAFFCTDATLAPAEIIATFVRRPGQGRRRCCASPDPICC
jgi:hypothetical protein